MLEFRGSAITFDAELRPTIGCTCYHPPLVFNQIGDVERCSLRSRYQARNWNKPRRAVAKVEWHPEELYPRVGFIVINLAPAIRARRRPLQPARHGRARIKEGKGAIKRTRLSSRTFAPLMPKGAEPRSLTRLWEKLIEIGAKVVSHGRYVMWANQRASALWRSQPTWFDRLPRARFTVAQAIQKGDPVSTTTRNPEKTPFEPDGRGRSSWEYRFVGRILKLSKNYIVLRNSPDWLYFDREDSREFCRKCGLSETLIIDFIQIWDSEMSVRYQNFRHQVKLISIENYKSVNEGVFLNKSELQFIELELDDLIVFVDDDDWLSPDLFRRLRCLYDVYDGVKWGSIRLGVHFSSSADARSDKVLYLRKIDRIIYTNNYAVTGQAINRLGYDALFEHGAAQSEFDGGRYRATTIPEYLSVANKHPCCTMAARFFLGSESFVADPRAAVLRFSRALAVVRLAPEMNWMAAPIHALAELVNSAVAR